MEGHKKLEQVLQIDPPNELVFKGPFKDVVTTTLSLTNPTEKTVTFKVKTTAPRHYCVKPNSGLVKPNECVNVDVMLQPFEYEAAEHKRHKFMVQTMFVGEDVPDVEALWKMSDQSAMMDSKLKCVFEMPKDIQEIEDESESPERTIEIIPGNPPPSSSSISVLSSTPSGRAQTPASALTTPSDTSRKSSGLSANVATPYSDVAQEAPAFTSAKAQATGPRQNKVEEQIESLKADNLKLKEEIAKLKEEGPRQRLVKDSGGDTSQVAGLKMSQELNASQISPILAAILALIIGYLIGKFLL